MLLYPHVPESDELAYLSMAQNLIAGKGIVDNAGNFAFYNMGYAFFVLAPVQAMFHDSVQAFRVANEICGAISIALVYAVAREAGANRNARLIAGLLWALYLPASVYGVYLAKENLMIPLMLGVLWCALRMMRSFGLGIALFCGCLLGLLALTGNAALSLGAAVGAALSASRASGRTRVLGIAAIVVVGGLITSPWLVRNAAVVGAPVMNTNGGFNFYLGNNPSADGMFMSIADTPRGPTWHALRRQEGELKASETLKHEALVWVADHPGTFAALAVKKLGLFWMPPVHNGEGETSNAEKLIRLGWLIEYTVLVIGALASLRYLRNDRSLFILWIAVAAYSAVHMGFYVIFRYREPIMPLLCVVASIALERAAAWVFKWNRHFVYLDDPENPFRVDRGGPHI